MLLYNRRLALVHSALTAMEALWFTPLFLPFWKPRIAQPLALYALLLAGGMGWMVIVDLLGRSKRLGRYDRPVILALGLLSTLLLWRGLLYSAVPWDSLRWLGPALNRLTRLEGGPRPELVLLVANGFLWGRAIWSTSRSLTSLGVSNSFGWGFLLLLVNSVLCSVWGGRTPPATFVWLYLGLGLLALTLARSDEKAALSHSAGGQLPWSRLGQLLFLGGVFALLAVAFVTYLPGVIRAALDVLASVLAFVVIGLQIFLVLLWLVVFRIVLWITKLAKGQEAQPQELASFDTLLEELRRQAESVLGREIVLASWALTLIRYLPFIVLALGVAVGLVLLLRRVRHRARHYDREQAQREGFNAGDLWRRGVEQLRGVADMIRRYGLSRQLLDAISVQNIYINVTRLGARRGHPRPKSQPPDLYLAALIQVFADQAAALERITEAYMRVHYGDHPITAVELAQLQADYGALRHAARQQGVTEDDFEAEETGIG